MRACVRAHARARVRMHFYVELEIGPLLREARSASSKTRAATSLANHSQKALACAQPCTQLRHQPPMHACTHTRTSLTHSRTHKSTHTPTYLSALRPSIRTSIHPCVHPCAPDNHAQAPAHARTCTGGPRSHDSTRGWHCRCLHGRMIDVRLDPL